MALDTRNARGSCIGVGLPFVRVLPMADGTIDAADKRQTALSYRAEPGSGVEPPIVPGLFWPETLPPFPERPGFLEETPEGSIRSGIEGLPAGRQRSQAGAIPFTLPFKLTRAQVETLDNFYEVTCVGGAVPFAWTHPRTLATAMLRFTARPTYQALAYDAWDVECAMEVLPQ